jgi:hypothetical protein
MNNGKTTANTAEKMTYGGGEKKSLNVQQTLS